MQLPFIGGSYNLDSRPASVQRTINLVPVPLEPGNERAPWVLKDVPGLTNVALVEPETYPAWNPLDKNASVVLSVNNTVATLTAALGSLRGFGRSNASGSYYYEITIGGADERQFVGIGDATATLSNYPGVDIAGIGYYGYNGQIYVNGTTGATNATFGVGDVIGVLMTGVALTFYKNGILQPEGRTLAAGTYYPMWGPGWANPGARIGTLNTGPLLLHLPPSATPWGVS